MKQGDDQAPILRNALVMLGDQDISHCIQSITIEAGVGEVTRVALRLLPGQVEIDLEALDSLIFDLEQIRDETKRRPFQGGH